MKTSASFLLILMCSATVNAQSQITAYGGLGFSNSTIQSFYPQLGFFLPLNKKNTILLNLEASFSSKKATYTFYNPKDYSYLYQRQYYGPGIHYRLKIAEKWSWTSGINFNLTRFKSTLETQDTFLKSILLQEVNRSIPQFAWSNRVDFNLKANHFLYFKAQLQGLAGGLLPPIILNLGYAYQFNVIDKE